MQNNKKNPNHIVYDSRYGGKGFKMPKEKKKKTQTKNTDNYCSPLCTFRV